MLSHRRMNTHTETAGLFAHLHLVSTRAVQTEQLAAAAAVAKQPTENERCAGAIDALKRAGVDAFLREQGKAMEDAGHWVDVLPFNQNGNRLAAITFVPTAGEQPEGLFGPCDFRNTVMLSIWATRDGVRVEVSTRGMVNCNRKPVRFTAAQFTHESLVESFSDFVAFAVRWAALPR
jgi:hypothetical protein